MTIPSIRSTYYGSNGQDTMALYAELQTRGPAGIIAMNLFRACKASERAKQYRGGIPGKGSYRQMAYEKKNWSIGLLCDALTKRSGLKLSRALCTRSALSWAVGLGSLSLGA